VLDANPLDDCKSSPKIAEVMNNGRLYDAAGERVSRPSGS
jgi:hypothetical protein